MSGEWEIWTPSATVQAQEVGPDYLGMVDEADWSIGHGFYRGYFSAFRIRPDKSVWFHFPLVTPTLCDGRAVSLNSTMLLWETKEDARLDWVTLQHGGMDRLELMPRGGTAPSEHVPFAMPPDAQGRIPETSRQFTEFALGQAFSLRFGVQLCVMITAGNAGGLVRLYGAGARFSAT